MASSPSALRTYALGPQSSTSALRSRCSHAPAAEPGNASPRLAADATEALAPRRRRVHIRVSALRSAAGAEAATIRLPHMFAEGYGTTGQQPVSASSHRPCAERATCQMDHARSWVAALKKRVEPGTDLVCVWCSKYRVEGVRDADKV
jgi:hypothetical protein